jgi:deoxyribodipyrimidine photo-lyase
MASDPIIVWFRRDLRIADNPALLYAARHGQPVLPLYVSGWEDDDRWAPGKAGRWWLEQSLGRLAASLASRGAPLHTLHGRVDEELPLLAREIGAREVVWNRLYEPYPRELEGRVAAGLERAGVRWRAFDAELLFDPENHFSASGRPFVQFTAFWRSCLSLPEPAPPAPEAGALRGVDAVTGTAPSAASGMEPRSAHCQQALESAWPWEPRHMGTPTWVPGEAGAQACLQRFLQDGLADYDVTRDVPGIEGTSRLSPHLHFGEMGPRQVWHAVREVAWTKGSAPGPAAPGQASFLRQLGWREFAHYLLVHFPHIPEEPFRPEFADFPWEDDPEGLEAWKRGETGYPLVDAAMHQLLAEGWVHNRARMVAASFLTKDLLIPWQQGAAWFWDRLVDADLAGNTLGWQWTAGSGPDSAPYFRVFNPVLQARRFDPDGAYARAWSGRAFDPAQGDRPAPRPIVDHAEARARALAAFRSIRRAGTLPAQASKVRTPSGADQSPLAK